MRRVMLDGHGDREVELDLCFGCHGIWFDHRESLQLSSQGVLRLFTILHAHREHPHTTLKTHMSCPCCKRGLVRGSDRTRSGSYVVYRCPQQHGRFGTFSSFMVEKGFVRHLSPVEVHKLAEKLRVIHCSNCGASVDLRKDHACPYCRSAFSLLDPKAVEKALSDYQLSAQVQAFNRGDVSGLSPDAQIQMRAARALAEGEIETQRENHRRRERLERIENLGRRIEPAVDGSAPFLDDLWIHGLRAVGTVIRGLFRILD